MNDDFYSYITKITTYPGSKVVMSSLSKLWSYAHDEATRLELKNLSKVHFGSRIYVDPSFNPGFDYVVNKFPDADLSSISAFLVPSEHMNILEVRHCAGCYIPKLKLILIKAGNTWGGSSSEIDRLFDLFSINVAMDDVFVHELIHAVSHEYDRQTRKNKVLEEEFAYSNTLDWFYDKGLNDEQIISKNFLPFLISDVLEKDNKEIEDSIFSSKAIYASYLTGKERRASLEMFANEYVTEVVNRAIDKGKSLIKMYKKYGRNQYYNTTLIDDDESRFSNLDFS